MMALKPQVTIMTIILLLSGFSSTVLANDAGSGGDAGGSFSTSTNLSSLDAIYYGNLSSNDTDDYYAISIPSDTGLAIELTSPSASDFDLYLYSQNQATIDYSFNGVGTIDSVTSNGTAVGGTTVYVRAKLWSGSGQYTMQFWFFSTTDPCNTSQNDANTGNDASDLQSSATTLSSTNGTHFGCVNKANDEYDWYSITIPNYHSISAQLIWNNTNVDLDLHLFDSNGSYLDYSYDYNPENISSGSANIGGTTVTLLVRAWASGDNYTLLLNFDNISNSQVYNQNDANSGGDVSGNFSNSYNIVGNNTYFGWISDSGDVNDIYSIYIPNEFAIEVTLTWNNSADDYDLGLFDQSENIISSSFLGNPEFVQSGATDVSNSTVYVVIQAGTGEGNYSINITLINQSNIIAFNQNDAYSGGDAGGTFSNATTINATDGVSYWLGYVDESVDEYDYYSVYVPTDYGITILLGYPSNSIFALGLYDSSNSQIDYSLRGQSPESVSTNNSGTYLGNSLINIEVWAYYGSSEYNLSIYLFTLDMDGDGFYDEVENECGSNPEDYNSTPLDTDADGICDTLDDDDDDDGVEDGNDSFSTDPNETTDTDGDSIGDNSDLDDDGDGWSDLNEIDCNTNQYDYADTPLDTDFDGFCDIIDDDDDDDGYLDISDAFPLDSNEWLDTDYDYVGNNADEDDDNDGFNDELEDICLSDSLISSSIPLDTDDDGTCDELDEDIDGDGSPNEIDSSPLDSTESVDTDGDGIGDNTDTDDDNDGYQDSFDIFPKDENEWVDFDNDGFGDNSDLDDDNDGWSDVDEYDCQSNSFDASSQPHDFDDDHICDIQDTDDDGDGTMDDYDPFPLDPLEWSDLDEDGIGDRQDLDDDGDTWGDIIEPNCGSDPLDPNSFPADFDFDHICDILDLDDDNDLTLDINDAFPFNPEEYNDMDGDGTGDNGDTDADGDSWPNSAELICGSNSLDSSSKPNDYDGDWTCDAIDPDDDGDGYVDLEDLFPKNSEEWEDMNGDGLGDNNFPLTLLDKAKLNSNTLLPIFIMFVILIISTVTISMKKKELPSEILENEDLSDSHLNNNQFIQFNDAPEVDNIEPIVDKAISPILEKFDEYPGWLWDPSTEEWVPDGDSEEIENNHQ